MKHLLMACFAVMLLASPVLAEKVNVDATVDMLKTALDLTDDQIKAVKPIIEDYKDAVDAAGKTKLERLSAVLTSEQMDKLKDLKKAKDKMND
jgi:Spy/CpxP family protein refolding chaperone